MKRKLGNACILLGTIFLLCALMLFLHNWKEENRAREMSGEYLVQLVNTIEKPYQECLEEESGIDTSDPDLIPEIPEEMLTAEDLIMTEVIVDGNAYIGYLSIPSLNLELPVLADWDYSLLQVAPCRYSGSVRGNDLVLMAHNYASHFGTISDLCQGDILYFVDMEGRAVEYQVVGHDVLDPSAVEEMTAGDFDLTLFTCTYGGTKRITVYCDRT